uniref:G-protein coupled receptors family 1 profile domain-containing protein n=1 Tax=Romanomermis culicivorax TaxID=13658 RepID=A0A915KED7_ROMCU
MTKSVSIIMLNTFLFSSVPFGWAFLSLTTNGSTTSTFDAASPFFYTLSLLSAATNILVYCAKYEKFRNVMLRQFSWCTAGCRRLNDKSSVTTIASGKPIFNRSTLPNTVGSMSKKFQIIIFHKFFSSTEPQNCVLRRRSVGCGGGLSTIAAGHIRVPKAAKPFGGWVQKWRRHWPRGIVLHHPQHGPRSQILTLKRRLTNGARWRWLQRTSQQRSSGQREHGRRGH